MVESLLKEVPTIDIWVNNAGVNQSPNSVWELDSNTINRLLDIDLKGTILCSKIIMNYMVKQGSGQIYNVEGFGSNDAYSLGLSVYGTAKRAVTYFTEALAYEVKYSSFVYQLSSLRRDIDRLKLVKKALLKKYF